MNTIVLKLQEEMKSCMKEKKKIELKTIRMVLSSIKNKSIELKKDLSEDETIAVLKKEVKSYKESLEFAVKADDTTMIEELNISIGLVQSYLPKEMSKEEATVIIEKLLNEANVTSISQKGLAMKTIMSVLKGKLDGKVINNIVSEILK